MPSCSMNRDGILHGKVGYDRVEMIERNGFEPGSSTPDGSGCWIVLLL